MTIEINQVVCFIQLYLIWWIFCSSSTFSSFQNLDLESHSSVIHSDHKAINGICHFAQSSKVTNPIILTFAVHKIKMPARYAHSMQMFNWPLSRIQIYINADEFWTILAPFQHSQSKFHKHTGYQKNTTFTLMWMICSSLSPDPNSRSLTFYMNKYSRLSNYKISLTKSETPNVNIPPEQLQVI